MTEEFSEFTPNKIERDKPRSIFVVLFAILFLLFLVAGFIGFRAYSLNQPAYLETKTILIEEGTSVTDITEILEKEGIVQSSGLLYLILTTQFDTTKIKASRYVFDEPLTTYQIAERIITGDFDSDLFSLTIFEGESREKMANRLQSEFTWFNSELFLESTQQLEGQLFPDTYFVPEIFTTEELADILHETYLNVIAEYEIPIADGTLTEDEVIILASIIEREANTRESMRTVAGIFLNRLEIDMALQADASIEYVLEHELNELAPGELAENLREFDSPYNTYLYPGLPPSPIGNPGRDAIEAVLFPIESNYFYYLTDATGVFHYAETYNQHLANVNRYLR